MKDGKAYDLVAWDIPSKSRTVLRNGVDGDISSLSPNGRSLLGCIFTRGGDHLLNVDYVVWDIASKSKTNLLELKKTFVLPVPGEFSPDGALLAIPDGYAKKIHIWKRDTAAKWSDLRVLDVGQGAAAPKPTLLEIALTPDGKQIFALLPLMNGTSDNGLLTVEEMEHQDR